MALAASAAYIAAAGVGPWHGWGRFWLGLGGVAIALLLQPVRVPVKVAWAIGVPSGVFSLASIFWAHGHADWARYGAEAAAVFVAIATLFWYARNVMASGTSKASNDRKQRRAQDAQNTATRLDVWEIASPAAMRHEIATTPLRPSIRALGWWARRQLPDSEFGIKLGYLGSRWLQWIPWRQVYAGFRQTTLVFGSPGSGKTGLLAHIAFHAPGALFTTSTRSDLAAWIHAKRLGTWRSPVSLLRRLCRWAFRRVVLGLPRLQVFIWNPTNYITAESNVYWSVLTGCEDYDVAGARAADMLPVDDGNSEARTWKGMGRPWLTVMLYAAANSGRNMRAVLRWNGEEPREDDPMKRCKARDEIERAVIAAGGDRAEVLLADIAEYYTKAVNTRRSVAHTVTEALKWLSYDKARMLGDAPRELVDGLNLRDLITGGHTLHIFGHERQPDLAPLNRCLIGEINDQLRRIAGEQPEERHDPPVLIVADEAWSTRLPFDEMSADMGGRGVPIVASFQSLSQMESKLGDKVASTFLGNANNVVYLNPGNDAGDLTKIAATLGRARYKNVGEDQSQADSHNIRATLDEADLRSMRQGEAAIARFGARMISAKVPQIWDVKGVKKAADLYGDIEVPEMVAEVEDVAVDEPATVVALPEQNGAGVHS
jgi:hypothetical protein